MFGSNRSNPLFYNHFKPFECLIFECSSVLVFKAWAAIYTDYLEKSWGGSYLISQDLMRYCSMPFEIRVSLKYSGTTGITSS